MTVPPTPRSAAAVNINHLCHGAMYEAKTRTGLTTTGEYMGVEVTYDDWRILLRGPAHTASIVIDDLASVVSAAA